MCGIKNIIQTCLSFSRSSVQRGSVMSCSADEQVALCVTPFSLHNLASSDENGSNWTVDDKPFLVIYWGTRMTNNKMKWGQTAWKQAAVPWSKNIPNSFWIVLFPCILEMLKISNGRLKMAVLLTLRYRMSKTIRGFRSAPRYNQQALTAFPKHGAFGKIAYFPCLCSVEQKV